MQTFKFLNISHFYILNGISAQILSRFIKNIECLFSIYFRKVEYGGTMPRNPPPPPQRGGTLGRMPKHQQDELRV